MSGNEDFETLCSNINSEFDYIKSGIERGFVNLDSEEETTEEGDTE